MKRIETEIWVPVPENPRKIKFAGTRTSGEVFAELRHRLESTGYLPDEYFSLSSKWDNGDRRMPEGAQIFSTVDYGGSEGIFIDVYLKWFDVEKNKNLTESFIMGKTLGETEHDLDRMNLIASAVTKAFHSDGVHTRYIRLGEPERSDACVMHLNGAERRLLIDSLIERHGGLTQETQSVESLLRRMTGNVTEYINETGQRPMRLDDFDATVLAIRDGNLPAFNEVYKKPQDKIGELLIHAAGRPGNVGKNMTMLLLAEAQGIPNDIYLNACKRAIDIGDADRTLMMANQASNVRIENDLSVYGDIISYAMSERKQHIAREILKDCSSEHIQAADPRILVQAIDQQDYQMAFNLVEKGIQANRCAAEVIYALTYHGNNRGYFNHLVKQGMEIDNNNYSALQACIRTDSPEQAKLLLDRGMDFDLYTQWAEKDRYTVKGGDTFNAVKDYWENEIKQSGAGIAEDDQDTGQTMGGI